LFEFCVLFGVLVVKWLFSASFFVAECREMSHNGFWYSLFGVVLAGSVALFGMIFNMVLALVDVWLLFCFLL